MLFELLWNDSCCYYCGVAFFCIKMLRFYKKDSLIKLLLRPYRGKRIFFYTVFLAKGFVSLDGC